MTKIKYKNYTITSGGLGYEYVHDNYEGVFEYDGETGAPSEYDHRSGSCKTIEQCKEEIDELEEENEPVADIDNGRDFTDYSDSEGGEVVFHN